MLGDAAGILADPCLGLSSDYPWAFVFATAATLFTFCLEYFLQRYFRYRLGLPQDLGGEPQDIGCNSRVAVNFARIIMTTLMHSRSSVVRTSLWCASCKPNSSDREAPRTSVYAVCWLAGRAHEPSGKRLRSMNDMDAPPLH